MPKRKHLDASPISADCQVSIENRDSKKYFCSEFLIFSN